MANAFGIVASSGSRFKVEGLQQYRPIGAFSICGRYRTVDFPISNMTNSGLEQIIVFIDKTPRSLTEHLGTGRHYNINSKSGRLQMLFAESAEVNEIYDTDIAAYARNLEYIRRNPEEYVVITPDYMVYQQDFSEMLQTHISSGADVTLLYHRVENARERYLNCYTLSLNRQKGLVSIQRNVGNAKERNIFMETFVMRKSLFLDLIVKAKGISSVYTLAEIINAQKDEIDVRGLQHHGFFGAITDFNSYYETNMRLIDPEQVERLFLPDWPIYTRTTDSPPTQYFHGARVKSSIVANGCEIWGTVENCVIGRGAKIGKGAVVRNSIVLAYTEIGEGVHVEHQVVDKWAKIIHPKNVIAAEDQPGYVRRSDIL